MRTLVIDTATDACSVALFDDTTFIAGEWRMLGRGHAENLISMIAALPDRGRAQRVAVSVGPGSFTGLRVGIAAARALGFAWNATVVGYPTLALIDVMARAQAGPTPIVVAMAAGHGEWFVERFDAHGTDLTQAASLTPEVAMRSCDEHVVAGNRAEEFVAARGFGQALEIWPDARSFALLPPFVLRDDASPIYGRAPDAKAAAA
jgi:tRNA threonylcarbamoyl adenosine modification protein YeaZ